MSDKLSAALHGSGPCRKSCCWTPYKCARDWTCDHHKDDARAQTAADEWHDAQLAAQRRAEQFATELRESAASSKRMSDWAAWK